MVDVLTQRFVVLLDCRQGIGLISEKWWPKPCEHPAANEHAQLERRAGDGLDAHRRIRPAHHTGDAHADDGAGTCKKSHADRIQRDDCRKRQLDFHILRSLSSTKPRNVSMTIPRCPSDGASDSVTGGQPWPLCPKRSATASLHTTGDGERRITHTSHQMIANCNNCCIQNLAEQNEWTGPSASWAPTTIGVTITRAP